ncbi:hypothetical protein HID58_090241 [Brassica napus]|uniref:Uncharacterized protein n=1 Tax=Brassica napus TaxID=3708 RepID=A0ABQ7X9F7_BRANA|nr:hypothetical protein HID58_090241 [Brassica napus]
MISRSMRRHVKSFHALFKTFGCGSVASYHVFICRKQSMMIQGSISGGIYELSSFDVTKSNQYFKLTTAPHTTLIEITETINPIPAEVFLFRSFDQVLLLANTNILLPGLFLNFASIVYGLRLFCLRLEML